MGMKLEGLDPSHPSLFCVLTVAEVWVLLLVLMLVNPVGISHCSFVLTTSLTVSVNLSDPRLQDKASL